jgi:hypothetical protein
MKGAGEGAYDRNREKFLTNVRRQLLTSKGIIRHQMFQRGHQKTAGNSRRHRFTSNDITLEPQKRLNPRPHWSVFDLYDRWDTKD